MKAFRLWVGALILSVLLGNAFAEAPAWLKTLAALEPSASQKGAPAVILLDETSLEVDAKGGAIEVHRFALKILHGSGSRYAEAMLVYNGASDKPLAFDMWILRRGAEVPNKAKGQWVDLAYNSPGAAIDETRVRTQSFSGSAVEGDVFGYETRLRTSLTVAQLSWTFGGNLPRVTERFVLTLPVGFELEIAMFGPVQPTPSHPSATLWSWTLLDQPYRPEEVAEYEGARLNATVCVQVRRPDAAATFALPTFRDWQDVTAFYSRLNSAQCDSSAALEVKVREIAPPDRPLLDRIQAITEHVQRVRYVGINKGLRYGYGWRPRKASEVFASGYGDCKDKANVAVAMLRAAGITAYPVIALLDRDRVVQESFPSPMQFNHAIVAIAVPEAVDLPAVESVEGLGRLLFFDATDPHSLLGDLSLELQGSLAHVVAPGVNRLVALPTFKPAEGFVLQRRADLAISADGSLAMEASVTGIRQAGAMLRARFEKADSAAELEKLANQQLAPTLRTAKVGKVEKHDTRASDRCELVFSAQQNQFLQYTSANTAVLRLDVLSRGHLPALTDKPRQQPVDLQPLALRDEVHVTLPPGFVPEEIPPPVSLNSSFGQFSLAYEFVQGELTLRRQLILERKIVAAGDCADLRKFIGSVTRADRNALMITKAKSD